MKIETSAISVKDSLKINMLKIKNVLKLENIFIIQVNTEVLHIIVLIESIVKLK